ncbi:hypothetical protein EVAR_32252_1 [Eumeta japonica]|uniref:Uncharacterized protein n=1 Tax=Eumeta variegata TaxID=151549 RepID=A0A4C1X0B9_EUMVA|nr:hypothetical protein EVAR_32252_1 [Eumeta japonica]
MIGGLFFFFANQKSAGSVGRNEYLRKSLISIKLNQVASYREVGVEPSTSLGGAVSAHMIMATTTSTSTEPEWCREWARCELARCRGDALIAGFVNRPLLMNARHRARDRRPDGQEACGGTAVSVHNQRSPVVGCGNTSDPDIPDEAIRKKRKRRQVDKSTWKYEKNRKRRKQGVEAAGSLGAALVCARVAGLTERQRAMCRASPAAIAAVGDGLRYYLLYNTSIHPRRRRPGRG